MQTEKFMAMGRNPSYADSDSNMDLIRRATEHSDAILHGDRQAIAKSWALFLAALTASGVISAYVAVEIALGSQ